MTTGAIVAIVNLEKDSLPVPVLSLPPVEM